MKPCGLYCGRPVRVTVSALFRSLKGCSSRFFFLGGSSCSWRFFFLFVEVPLVVLGSSSCSWRSFILFLFLFLLVSSLSSKMTLHGQCYCSNMPTPSGDGSLVTAALSLDSSAEIVNVTGTSYDLLNGTDLFASAETDPESTKL